MRLSEDEFSMCLGQPAAKFFAYKLGELHAEGALAELRRQSVFDAEHIKPFPGVIEFLEKLRIHGKNIAVWTSRDQSSANLVLEKTGIGPLIDHCVSGCCVSKHKPDPEGLQKIAGLFECDVSELVMVGDHDYDVKAAAAVGAYGIRASWHDFEPTEKCAYACEVAFNVASLSERV